MPKKKSRSLRLKTGIIVVIALLIGIGSYYFSDFIGNKLIENIYLSEARCDERMESYVDSFRSFVDKNQISSTNLSSIKSWCKSQKYVYISVYSANKLYYETDGNFGEIYNADSQIEYYLDEENAYPIDFSDGMNYVSIIEFSEAPYYTISTYTSLGIAMFIILLIILTYNQGLIRRVIRLSGEVREVCYGNLEKDIFIKGEDELGTLGDDVNEMRRSIIDHYEKEQEALNSNSELLTSISHDIRTPLTALIGYSEMMTDGHSKDCEELTRYANVCKDKAYQLKNMTDSMFKYFLVYGNNEIELDIQRYQLAGLLEQLLGEYTIGLRQKGYIVSSETLKDDCIVDTDVNMLKRVFDNVFSNTERYADKSKEIRVSSVLNGSNIIIQVVNYIEPNCHNPESTKIGLKTCEKIMSLLGGKFETYGDKKTFSANVILPRAIN